MTTTTIDGRVAQRFDALTHANDIRIRRARLKRQIRARAVRLEDILREPEWFLFSVPVHELLAWAPWIGQSKVNQMLRRTDVWPLREVGRLTARQRRRLLVEIGGRA